MDPVRPDDLKRSQSGRVPKWVIDEANGIAPTELVPFRSDPRPLGKPKKERRWARTGFWMIGAVILAGSAFALDNPSTGGTTLDLHDKERTYPQLGDREEKERPAAAVVASSSSTSFRFSAFQPGSKIPVTWSPCRRIHYVVRPDHAPPEGPQLIANAFARLSAATGLVFVNDGATTEGPGEDRELYQKDVYGDHWAPVLVTWATADEVPDFGVDVIGEAGPARVMTGSGDSTFISGTVALDARRFNALLRAGDVAEPQAVLLHELGHLMGLAHVNDQAQLMFPRGGIDRVEYGAGDLAGLAALGSGSCQPDA